MFNNSIKIPANTQQQPIMNNGLYNQFRGSQRAIHIP